MQVVFLCVGAAKAGTSWLFRQLSVHPDCHFRAIKELHYFDALDAGRLERQAARHAAEHYKLQNRLAEAGREPGPGEARWLQDRADWLTVLDRGGEDLPAYLDYLGAGAGAAQVVGEMTPAYALLEPERLGRMARMAGDVRVLYLVRDPVEQLWSHVRMIAARRDGAGRAEAARCGRIFDRVLAGGETEIAARGDYGAALARLAAAVPGAKLLIEVFEEMVAGAGLARICDFLGIGRVAGALAPVHAGQPVAMTADQRLRAGDWLAPQYEAAEAALGRTPGAWGRKGVD